MFDSLYSQDGSEWQTKALECNLDVFRIGDEIPGQPPLPDYQMEVIGGKDFEQSRWAYANIKHGQLTEVPVPRDPRVPLCLYSSGWVHASQGDDDGHSEDD